MNFLFGLRRQFQGERPQRDGSPRVSQPSHAPARTQRATRDSRHGGQTPIIHTKSLRQRRKPIRHYLEGRCDPPSVRGVRALQVERTNTDPSRGHRGNLEAVTSSCAYPVTACAALEGLTKGVAAYAHPSLDAGRDLYPRRKWPESHYINQMRELQYYTEGKHRRRMGQQLMRNRGCPDGEGLSTTRRT